MRCAAVLLFAAASVPAVELRIAAYDGYASPAVVTGFAVWAKETQRAAVHCAIAVLGVKDELYKLISGTSIKPLGLAAISHYSNLAADPRSTPLTAHQSRSQRHHQVVG